MGVLNTLSKVSIFDFFVLVLQPGTCLCLVTFFLPSFFSKGTKWFPLNFVDPEFKLQKKNLMELQQTELDW